MRAGLAGACGAAGCRGDRPAARRASGWPAAARAAQDIRSEFRDFFFFYCYYLFFPLFVAKLRAKSLKAATESHSVLRVTGEAGAKPAKKAGCGKEPVPQPFASVSGKGRGCCCCSAASDGSRSEIHSFCWLLIEFQTTLLESKRQMSACRLNSPW